MVSDGSMADLSSVLKRVPCAIIGLSLAENAKQEPTGAVTSDGLSFRTQVPHTDLR